MKYRIMRRAFAVATCFAMLATPPIAGASDLRRDIENDIERAVRAIKSAIDRKAKESSDACRRENEATRRELESVHSDIGKMQGKLDNRREREAIRREMESIRRDIGKMQGTLDNRRKSEAIQREMESIRRDIDRIEGKLNQLIDLVKRSAKG